MKLCSKCLTEKNLSEFYAQPNSQPTKDGRTYWCKKCYAQNYLDNRERQLLSNRKAHIKRKYCLTLEEYEELIGGGCSVCAGKARGQIILDHCHATNSVRAPLCTGCNMALGQVCDDPQILRDLADYLERHSAA